MNWKGLLDRRNLRQDILRGASIAISVLALTILLYFARHSAPELALTFYFLYAGPIVFVAYNWGRGAGLLLTVGVVSFFVPIMLGTVASSSVAPDQVPLLFVIRGLELVASVVLFVFLAVIGERAGIHRQQRLRYRKLDKISERLQPELQEEELLQTILTHSVPLFKATGGEIVLRNEETDQLEVAAAVGISQEARHYLQRLGYREKIAFEGRSGGTNTLADQILDQSQPFLHNRLESDPRYVYCNGNTPFMRPGVHSILAVPLRRGRESFGLLSLFNKSTGDFDQSDADLLVRMADKSVAAIENARLYRLTDASLARRVEELSALNRIAQTLVSSLDLDQTLKAVLAALKELFPYAFAEICLWEPVNRVMRSYAWRGERTYAEATGGVYHLDEGYSGWIARHREQLWISDIEADRSVRPKVDSDEFPFRSVVGLPLKVGQQFIGALEMLSYQPDAFPISAQSMLEALCHNAAIAIHNAQLYQERQQRLAELAGVLQISKAISSVRDTDQVYGLLTERIARLMDVELCGVLLYEPESEELVSRPPFYGVPAELVEFYRIPVRGGSPMRGIWEEAQYWYSNDVLNDPLTAEAGLRDLASVAGVRSTMFAALAAGDRRLGIIQVSNKRSGVPFEDADARLLSIFANQAAVVLENARLYESEQERQNTLEALQVSATAMSTALDPETVIKTGVSWAMDTFRVDGVSVMLPDMWEQSLVIEAAEGLSDAFVDAYRLTREQVMGYLERYGIPARLFEAPDIREVVSGRLVDAEDLCWVVVMPLASGGEPFGVIYFYGKGTTLPPSTEEMELMTLFANQAAVSIQNARLYTQTDERLRLRLSELTALNRIGQELNATLDLERILNLVLREAVEVTNANHGNINLMNWETGALEARATFGLDQSQFEKAKISLELGQGVISRAAREGEPVVVDDVTLDPDYVAVVPETRSELAVPILHRGIVVGVINLESSQIGGFTQTHIAFLEALATQAAVALANARTYQEQMERAELLRQRAEQLGHLFEIGQMLRTDRSLEEVLTEVAFAVQETAGFEVALISVREGDAQKRVAAAGVPIAEFERMKRSPQPWADLEKVFQKEFLVSNSYYIPYEYTEVTQHLDTLQLEEGSLEREPDQWHPADMLLVPLRGSGDTILGILSVDQPRDGQVPDRSIIEVLEIFGAQAAFAIENTRLVGVLRQRVDELTLFNEVGRSISARLDLEGVMDTVVEAASELLKAPRSILFLRASINDASNYVPWSARGYDWLAVSSLHFRAGEGLVGDVAEKARAIVIADVRKDERYRPFLPVQEDADKVEVTGSIILVPLIFGGMVIGVLSAEHPSPAAFSSTDITSLSMLADQAAIAVENARLFQQTQRQLQEAAVVNEIGHALSATVVLDELLAVLKQQVARLVTTESFYIALYDDVTDQLSFPLFLRQGQAVQVDPISSEEGLTGHIIRTGEPLLLMAQGSEKVKEMGLPWLGQPAQSYLGVPMRLGEKVVGVIAVQDFERNYVFDTGHERALSTVAVQAAIAIQNARLYEETFSRTRQLSRLNEAAQAISSELELDRVLQTVSREMTELLKATGCIIWDYDPKREAVFTIAQYQLEPKVTANLSDLSLLDRYPFKREVLTERVTVQVHAAEPESDPAELARMQMAGIESLLMVPLVTGDHVVGLLELVYESAHNFSPSELQLVQTMANQAAVAIENARLFEEVRSYRDELEERVQERTEALQKERDRVESLYRITSELSASLDLDRVLNRALVLVLEAVKSEQGSIFMLDQQTGKIFHRAMLLPESERGEETLPPGGVLTPFRRGEGLAGQVLASKQPSIIDDLVLHARSMELEDYERQYRSVLAMPLIVSDEALGVLILYHSETEFFTREHLRLVEAAAAQVAAAINNAELYRYVRESANRLGQMIKTQQVETTKTEAILEGVADGVMVTDPDGLVIRFNAAAEHILSTPRAQVLGRSIEELGGLYGASGTTWLKAVDSWIVEPSQSGENVLLSDRLELEDRIVSVRLSPVAVQGEFLGTVSLFRDITQEVEVERAKSEFVSTVSHELRTPMTSVKGYADLLVLGAAGDLNEHQKRFLSIIKNSADRLTMLVNDLLDIGRIDTDRIELKLKEVELASAVEIVVESLKGRSRDKRQELITEIPQNLPAVWADQDRLIQILTNLVSNAQQYTPTGGQVRLKAAACKDAGTGAEMVKISVSDDGIGITPEDQAKIFDRFFRADHPMVQETAGTGLGLSITQSLVLMHGGRLWVESEPGKGSTFEFTLPRVLENKSQLEATHDEPSSES
jgi:GAF domain-containing protein